MTLGFIMLRHVQCKNSNFYWIESYKCLRTFYPLNQIIIVDDNSNYEFITDITLQNTIVIDSEYKGRGELLPYIYYLRNPIFDKAVIIHDSVFFNQYINFDQQENMPLWHFDQRTQDRIIESHLISKLDNMQPLLDLYDTKLWNGCFGGMSVIRIDFIQEINAKYNIENLIHFVTCRNDRMCLERVLGLIFSIESKNDKKSTLGDIITYCKWGYPFHYYNYQKNNFQLPKLPVIKVWSGR